MLDVVQASGEACRPLLRLLPPEGAPDRRKAEQRVRSLATEFVARAQEREALRPRNHHRAFQDADSLWRTWRTISDLAADWLENKGNG